MAKPRAGTRLAKPSRDQWAYFAGIFDGEGHVAFRQPPAHGVYLVINHTDRGLLEYLWWHFGGAIYHTSKAAAHHRAVWRWQVTREAEVERLLIGMAPWLRVKLVDAQRVLGQSMPPGAQFDLHESLPVLH